VSDIKEKFRALSAIQFRLNIVSALDGKAVHDSRIMENNLMEKFHWTYKELLETPLEVIMFIGFIHVTKNDREKITDLKRKEEEDRKRT
jgi:hypothetical protein